MEDKRVTQLALPIEYDKAKAKQYAKQSWNMTFARQKKVSVYSKRIIAKVLSLIKDTDTELRPYYEIKAMDILASTNLDKKGIYRELKKAFEELAGMFWMFEDEKTFHFKPKHLLNTIDENARCEYIDGTIYIALNPTLSQYFIALKHYTSYELNSYMNFSSWYSMRIFEILSAWKDKGGCTFKIENFRELMDCKGKYKENSDLIKRTLTEPLKELENTELEFEYKLTYSSKSNKGRPSVEFIEFILKKEPPKEIPKEWLEKFPEHRQTIELLINTYSISEKNIIEYIKPIGMKRIKELIKTWYDLNNDNKIKNIPAFCNTAFVAEGIKAINKKLTE